MPSLADLLEKLEAHHGPQKPVWPTDPWRFLVWNYSAYPASDAKCAKGWESLKRTIGIEPDRILAATSGALALALKPGGMIPEERAMRLKEAADRALDEFGGDLAGALKRLPLARARAALKTFPGIANPGADRILLFAGIAPVAAVPSNCTHVAARIFQGGAGSNYNREYTDAQKKIETEIPPSLDARQRAYLLLKEHGQQICKRSAPMCSACTVARSCAYARAKRLAGAV
jgi:endonuclease-3